VALLSAWENKACRQWEFWGLTFHTGLREHGSVALLLAGEQSLWAEGVLGPDFPHRLQGAQFCGTAAGGTKPAGLHLLLPVEQWELWDLLTQGCQFPWHFRVELSGYVLRGSMEL
jgi:hypothetical protein